MRAWPGFGGGRLLTGGIAGRGLPARVRRRNTRARQEQRTNRAISRPPNSADTLRHKRQTEPRRCKTVRENFCRPLRQAQGKLYGTRSLLPRLPRTYVRGFILSPLRGWMGGPCSTVLPEFSSQTQLRKPRPFKTSSARLQPRNKTPNPRKNKKPNRSLAL